MLLHAIFLPQEEDRPLYKVAVDGLSGMQDAVGGYIQVLDLTPLGASLVMDENGKLSGKDINRRATLLFWLLFPSVRHRDVIVGDAIIIGTPDNDGNSTDVPEAVTKLLFETKSYKAEFQTFDDANKFNGNMMRFDDYFTAVNYALAKSDAWTMVERCRVVPAED